MKNDQIGAAILLVGAVLGLHPLHARDEQSSEEKKFAEAVIEELRSEFPDAQFELDSTDPLQLNVSELPSLEFARVPLQPMFKTCRTIQDKGCRSYLDWLVSTLQSGFAPPSASELQVVVISAHQWQELIESIADENQNPPHKQIGEDLFAVLAYRTPVKFQFATTESLRNLDLDHETAWTIASQQIQAELPTLPLEAAKSSSQNLFAFRQERYLGSMMVDLEKWSEIAEAAGPGLFVVPTSNQFVLVGWLPDGEKLNEIKTFADVNCRLSAVCISPNVYRFRDGQWMIAE